MTQLPDKPSALIRLALTDLRKVEKQPDIYAVNMYFWHRSYDDPVFKDGRAQCSVCLAGAVMAKSLNVSPDCNVRPESFEASTYQKLMALDCFRKGDLRDGLMQLSLHRVVLPNGMRVADYDEDKVQFHSDMEALASILDARGL